MWKEIIILPLYTLIAGFILRAVDLLTVFILVSTMNPNEWTLEMGSIVFFSRSVLSVAMLVGIGFLLRKQYSRNTFLKSTTLMVIYSIAILAIEQITQYYGSYSMAIYDLYVPVEMFTWITSLLARISGAESINWLYVVPSIFAPYLLLLFSKSDTTIRENDS